MSKINTITGNFSKQLPTFKNDQTFERSLFVRPLPHTSIAQGKTGMVFRYCNLTNCDVPPGSVVENCLTVQISFCSHLHPEMDLPVCAVDCEHRQPDKQWTGLDVTAFRQVKDSGGEVRILNNTDAYGVVTQVFEQFVWVYKNTRIIPPKEDK